MRIAFAGTAATLEVPGSPEFEVALKAAAPGWSFAASQARGDPQAIVTEEAGGFSLAVRSNNPIHTTAVGAACGAIVALANAWVDERPDQLCFHGGAALLDGQLIVFPNRYRAGKSTLIARLASMGLTIFGDDILPVSADDDAGVAFGLAPRLRIPLPEAASQTFRNFVEEHSAASDGRYCYLRLGAGLLAARGATAPLGAVVLLDRVEHGRPELLHASRSAALQALIERNFARAAPSGALLNRLHSLMDRLPRVTLRYSNFEDAAELLAATFASWPPHIPTTDEFRVEVSPLAGPDIVGGTKLAQSFAPETLLIRNTAVTLHQVEDSLFLATPDGLSIHRLNATGAGLWTLLAEPISQDQSIEVLCDAFPDAEPRAVADDVSRLFAALLREGLIIEAGR
ncbi:PqqD family protein [Mesorhizobium sp. KR9-304]|uniref:PqqD family protein n=1 Tax=Mesorhizobium sp. KR9-304 TaxID=3156614 RepID=UPI0032B3C22A